MRAGIPQVIHVSGKLNSHVKSFFVSKNGTYCQVILTFVLKRVNIPTNRSRKKTTVVELKGPNCWVKKVQAASA